MRIKIEIGDIDPVLMLGQIAALCEVPEMLRTDSMNADTETDSIRYLTMAEAIDGLIEMLGGRVEMVEPEPASRRAT